MGSTPAAREGFPSAYVSKVVEYKARRLARKRCLGGGDADDWRQELTLRLFKKRWQYDSARGASFDTFASRVLESEVQMIVRDARRQKRRAAKPVLSLDAPADGGSAIVDAIGSSDDVVATAAARECSAAVAGVTANLPATMVALAEGLKRGDSVTAIADSMGCSRQGVYRAMTELRKRFESAGLDRF
jgi:DNA-directed RNA polymerase specialized sigma24 family protein